MARDFEEVNNRLRERNSRFLERETLNFRDKEIY